MCFPIPSLLLFFLLGQSTSSNPDDSLPVYLRGLKWNKVQEYLKEDLRLSDSVLPTNYAIELSLNVRGHAGALKSDFNGSVYIYLNFTKPVDKIELHSNGLVIEQVLKISHWLVEILIESKPIGVVRITANSDKETITIHTNRTIQYKENFILQISYRGVAKMDEYGLYENWDPKYNQSLDSNGPYILATNNFPTGARFWFPCFDEPDKRATFELQINHPSGLNVYSTNDLKESESISAGRALSSFERTTLLSTYQLALSVNHLSSQYLEVKGFGKVRLIRSMNSHNYWGSAPVYNYESTDIPTLLVENLNKLADVNIGKIPKGKLDIIIVEGTRSNSFQPGLITFSRSNLWSDVYVAEQLPDLVQLRIGNRIAVKASNQMWINDMFVHYLENATSSLDILGSMTPAILDSYLRERPLRDLMMHSTSTKQYLASRQELPAVKASQMLRLFLRYCPESEKSLQKYIANSMDGFADVNRFIDEMSNACQDSKGAREFLESFIDQPGKALLTVKRSKDSVIIKQTRYHSSYFDTSLRDTKTRYTIPLFFTIDGRYSVKLLRKNDASLAITVPESSVFLIDHDYDHLYFAFYEDVIVQQVNGTSGDRLRLVSGVGKGMIAAVNIGFMQYYQVAHQLKEYFNMSLLDDTKYDIIRAVEKAQKRESNTIYGNMKLLDEGNYFEVTESLTRAFFFEPTHSEYSENQDFFKCDEWSANETDWNGSFNNDAKYWRKPTDIEFLVQHMNCLTEWANATNYQRFLERNFLGENTQIRPIAASRLASRYNGNQWRDFHRFFFRHAANFTNHRFNLLADAILNQVKVPVLIHYDYPNEDMVDDYLQELREFVIRNPRRAASMSSEIEMRLEREYIRKEQHKFHNETRESMEEDWLSAKRIKWARGR